MNIHLTKQQLERVISESVNFHYERENIPQMMKEIEEIVNEGKKVVTASLNNLKSLSVLDIMENPIEIRNQIENINKMREVYYQKYKKYYDIYEIMDESHYDMDKDNKDLWAFYKSINKLDDIQTDLDNVRDVVESFVDVILDGTDLKDMVGNLEKKYPTQVIDVSHQLPSE